MTDEKKHLNYVGQTITARYLGPTNYRGARIVATGCWHGVGGIRERVVISYPYDLPADDAHYAAVLELVRAASLPGAWRDAGSVGYLESADRRGYVYFLLPQGGEKCA